MYHRPIRLSGVPENTGSQSGDGGTEQLTQELTCDTETSLHPEQGLEKKAREGKGSRGRIQHGVTDDRVHATGIGQDATGDGTTGDILLGDRCS